MICHKVDGPYYKYEHIAHVVVQPDKHFPLAMLVYDHCWPMEEHMVGQLVMRNRSTEPIRIKIGTLHTTKNPPFSVDRWESFGVTLE